MSGLPPSKMKENDVTIAQWGKVFLDRDAQSCTPSTRVHLTDDFVVLSVRRPLAWRSSDPLRLPRR